MLGPWALLALICAAGGYTLVLAAWIWLTRGKP
jgi:hypothetical protein